MQWFLSEVTLYNVIGLNALCVKTYLIKHFYFSLLKDK